MAALGTAAGVIAVISLSIQLAERAEKLHNFWVSVRDAPLEIKVVIEELEILRDILTQIAADETEQQRYHSTTHLSIKVMEKCQINLDALYTITTEFWPHFTESSNKRLDWTTLKAASNRDKIEHFQKLVERTKSSVMLEQLRLLR